VSSEPHAAHDVASAQANAPNVFFCSQSYPGDIILRAHDWANKWGPESAPVAGRFHTPVERIRMQILLRSDAAFIIVLARAAQGWRAPKPLGPAINAAVATGPAQIVSPFPATQARTTATTAEARNHHILTPGKTVLIVHAPSGGQTEVLAAAAITRGFHVKTYEAPSNDDLVVLGATTGSMR
jgi:hypothetical protein